MSLKKSLHFPFSKSNAVRQVTDSENVTENYITPMNPIEKIQTRGKCGECDPGH